MSSYEPIGISEVEMEERIESEICNSQEELGLYLQQKVNKFSGFSLDPLYLECLLRCAAFASYEGQQAYLLGIEFMALQYGDDSVKKEEVVKALLAYNEDPVRLKLFEVLGAENSDTIDSIAGRFDSTENTSDSNNAIITAIIALSLSASEQNLAIRIEETGRCNFYYNSHDLYVKEAMEYISIQNEGWRIAQRVYFELREREQVTLGLVDSVWDKAEEQVQKEKEEIEQQAQVQFSAFWENQPEERKREIAEAFLMKQSEITQSHEIQKHVVQRDDISSHGVKFSRYPPRPT